MMLREERLGWVFVGLFLFFRKGYTFLKLKISDGKKSCKK